MERNIFRFPLWKRSIIIHGKRHNGSYTLRTLGDCGVFVSYAHPWQNSWLYLIKQPIKFKQTYCLVEASDILKALRVFYQNWYGAKIGGPALDQKALFIDNTQVIIQYPPCDRRRLNGQGEYMCGVEDKWNPGCGEYGMCCICGFDSPISNLCPVERFFEQQPNQGWKNLKTFAFQGTQFSCTTPD